VRRDGVAHFDDALVAIFETNGADELLLVGDFDDEVWPIVRCSPSPSFEPVRN
jgi:hypothetical protein